MAVLPVDLDCPDPDACPVAASLPRLRSTTLRAGSPLYRVYDATWGYDEHNPGCGDACFSPIDDPTTTNRLPSMYLASTPAAALRYDRQRQELISDAARLAYPVRDGVPIMLIDEARELGADE